MSAQMHAFGQVFDAAATIPTNIVTLHAAHDQAHHLAFGGGQVLEQLAHKLRKDGRSVLKATLPAVAGSEINHE